VTITIGVSSRAEFISLIPHLPKIAEAITVKIQGRMTMETDA
jgi:hypothetical protein